MEIINSVDELLDEMDEQTKGYLQYAMENPNSLIPAYPENCNTPQEAEEEARISVKRLRDITVAGVKPMPVFVVCHVERDNIWCEFSIKPQFVAILKGEMFHGTSKNSLPMW